VTSPALEVSGQVSPDGRWLAYNSDESGTFEVYVRAMEGRGKWQISPQGGGWPTWSPDGKELFFWSGNAVFVTDVVADSSAFKAGRARLLFEGPFTKPGVAYPSAIAPDGQRFVAFVSRDAAATDSHQHLQLVLNWYAELRATFGD
jgi:Tol biopolymer transport system component